VPLVADSDILRRVRQFSDAVERVMAVEDSPLSAIIEETLGPVEAVIKGRPTLMFGTNSYLGLNFHPECIRAASEALAQYGTGSTASRVASGNHRLHLELEKDIAALYGRSHAIVFSTGFMANLGVIAALAHEGDAIFIDSHSHASIFDAARLSGAQVRTFAHNDSRDLERLLAASDIPGTRAIVVLEGVYSVWGDVGDLKSIIAVAKRHGATVIVDEAHAMGIYGKHGRGAVEHLGLEDEVDVIVGTFSKSVGAIGGYCVTNRAEFRALRFMARSYLYTASLPLSIVASARAALRLISNDPGLRKTLWRNIETFHAGLSSLGLTLCAAPGPVGGIKMPGVRVCYDFWKGLLDRGVYVNMLMPPATPGGEVVLRFSLSAAHTPAQIEKAIGVFGEVSKALKVV
jgi:8-amino-7-oxononanoate synthase